MTQGFENTTPVSIDAGPPNTVTTSIEVTGFPGQVIKDLKVAIDVEHTWIGDLSIGVINPAGQRVVLVNRRGGRHDDFRGTVFDADASLSIRNASAPFIGNFQPEGDLTEFRDRAVDGIWKLEVCDRAFQDGGVVRRWSLTVNPKPRTEPAFKIDVRFRGGLTPTQQDAFDVAAQRWSSIIVGDLPSVRVFGEVVDDVVIDARGASIDGPNRILGQAGPTWLRPASIGFLPAMGVMTFDTADLSLMEQDGRLVNVITHEMGHVIGFGTIWSKMQPALLQGAGSINPTFVGANAMREFAVLQGQTTPIAVPVANTGGPGTRDSHWREAVFVNELMTGFLNLGANPISRVTIGSLEDLGYAVNYDAADPYTLPSALVPALIGMNAPHLEHGGYGAILPTDSAPLPEDAIV